MSSSIKRRKLDRSRLRLRNNEEEVQPAAEVVVAEPEMVGLELLPVDEKSLPIKFYSWFDKDIFGTLSRQDKLLCWVFVIIDWLEALYFIKYKIKVVLSRQELVDKCIPESKKYTYAYGLLEAVQWIERNGISLEKDYPWVGEKQPPQARKEGAELVHVKNVREVSGNNEKEILNLMLSKPLPAKMRYHGDVYLKMKYDMAKGHKLVYRMKRKTYESPELLSFGGQQGMDHAVMLAAFDTTDDGQNVYEVRDPNQKGAPGGGRYNVVRLSSTKEDEIEMIDFVVDAEIVYIV